MLSAAGVAVVGNAANQVFSTHGSGVVPAIQSARLLANALAVAKDPGDADVLWHYTAEFQRTLGAKPVRARGHLVFLHYRSLPGRRDEAKFAEWVERARALGV